MPSGDGAVPRKPAELVQPPLPLQTLNPAFSAAKTMLECEGEVPSAPEHLLRSSDVSSDAHLFPRKRRPRGFCWRSSGESSSRPAGSKPSGAEGAPPAVPLFPRGWLGGQPGAGTAAGAGGRLPNPGAVPVRRAETGSGELSAGRGGTDPSGEAARLSAPLARGVLLLPFGALCGFYETPV